MRRFMVALALVMLPALAAADEWTTYYEESGHVRTPRYAETVDYCQRLAKASPWLRYTTFGVSPQGRDLPLVIANKRKRFEPQKKRGTDHAVLFVQAAIHAGESDGKDAGMMLLRDIAVRKEMPQLLDNVTIVFIPIFNVDGHERFGAYSRINQNGPEEMGWRVTAQNLNLNRDYLKADAPEMRAWLRLFHGWDPDFFVDCHVTDGADYQYPMTYGMDVFGNMDAELSEWASEVYLPAVSKGMKKNGSEMFPYVYPREWGNPKSGLRSFLSTPRFSTGYSALCNRPALLVETHMLKNYKTRVTATYEILKQTLMLLNKEGRSLRELVAAADKRAASDAFRNQEYALTFQESERSRTVDFKGIEYAIEQSELTGAPWFRYNGKPDNYPVEYFDEQVPVETATLPAAYVIPPEWTDVTALLSAHNVKFERLKAAATLSVDSYRFANVSFAQEPFEGRHPVTAVAEPWQGERVFPRGSVVVPMNQRLSRVVAHILEPKGPDSCLYWGFFDTIFEQKEYSEGYVMEKMAREMMEKDPKLRAEFEEKKREEPAFAENARWIVNWFYQRTPYWDDRINLYPVGKLKDRETLSSLELE